MTQDEEKELALFKEWFYSSECWRNLDKDSAEQAWFARAKLDKERNEKENL